MEKKLQKKEIEKQKVPRQEKKTESSAVSSRSLLSDRELKARRSRERIWFCVSALTVTAPFCLFQKLRSLQSGLQNGK